MNEEEKKLITKYFDLQDQYDDSIQEKRTIVNFRPASSVATLCRVERKILSIKEEMIETRKQILKLMGE